MLRGGIEAQGPGTDRGASSTTAAGPWGRKHNLYSSPPGDRLIPGELIGASFKKKHLSLESCVKPGLL